MKRIIFLFAFSVILITSCQNDDEIMLEEIGLVVDYAGAGNCGFVIELENGSRIQPLYYPAYGIIFITRIMETKVLCKLF